MKYIFTLIILAILSSCSCDYNDEINSSLERNVKCAKSKKLP